MVKYSLQVKHECMKSLLLGICSRVNKGTSTNSPPCSDKKPALNRVWNNTGIRYQHGLLNY